MWLRLAVILCTLAAMDLPWVLVNYWFGIYRNRVVGGRRYAIPFIWAVILVGEALLLTCVVRRTSRWWVALLSGMFVGFVVYFTFNGTALTMFESWTYPVALMDTAWGTILFGVAACVGFLVRGSKFDAARHHPATLL